MTKILEKMKENKKILITLFLICIFCYYLTWTISQPFNSCPDEGMKWDICKYIYENNKLPHGEDEAIYDWCSFYENYFYICNTSICISDGSKVSKYNKYDISNIFYNKDIAKIFQRNL